MFFIIVASLVFIGFVFKHYRVKFKIFRATFSSSSRSWTPFNLLPSEAEILLEKPRSLPCNTQASDSLLFFGANKNGVKIFAEINRKPFSSAVINLNLTLSDGTVLESCGSSSSLYCPNWSSNLLTFEVVEPMKTWRIVYNGNLKNCQSREMDRQHVRVNLLWHGMSLPVMCKRNGFDSKYEVTSCRESILKDQYSGYEQWGTMIGTIQSKCADGTYAEEEVRLQSFRQRTWLEQDSLASKHLVFITETGDKFSFNCSPETIRNKGSEICGHFQRTNRNHEFIHRSAKTLSELGSFKKLSFSGKFGKYDFSIETLSRNNDFLQVVKCKSSSDTAVGFQRLRCLKETESAPDLSAVLRVYVSQCIPSSNDIVALSLGSVECCQVDLVGGKASSLAFMKIAKKHNLLRNVFIPDGICLTTATMKHHLATNLSLSRTMETLNDLGPDATDDILKEKCETIASLCTSTPLSSEVLDVINSLLQIHLSYAVRSSGIHEDGQTTSAAGQNETVLNVSGLSEISQAVRICWASLFSYRSVKYRRQHGLPVISTMGVVIQEMAPAKASGVAFTRHPVTGDPSLILINASSGLGDAVVSGSVDPDSITVFRSDSSKFSIVDQKCGASSSSLPDTGKKHDQITCSEGSRSSLLCLSSKQILDLSKVCANVEDIFGYSCDVEWAVAENKLYLLQARPITSTFVWSDFEIIHEFDTPCTENDVSTAYNAGEIFPSVTTPLTVSTVILATTMVSNRFDHFFNGRNLSGRYKHQLVISHHRVFINLMMTLFKDYQKNINPADLIGQLVFCGKIVCTEEFRDLAVKRNYVSSSFLKLLSILKILKSLLSDACRTLLLLVCRNPSEEKFSQNFEAFRSTEEVLANLPQVLANFQTVVLDHLQGTTSTYLAEVVLISILTGKNKDFTEDTFSDISSLITNCNKDVLSLKMPLLLEKICASIKRASIGDEFYSIPPKMGQEFLQQKCPSAYLQLQECIKHFGHRGMSELELTSDNWLTKPESLIEFLQRLVKNDFQQKTRMDPATDLNLVIQNLKTPCNNLNRKLLRILTPVVRKLVGLRELTKSGLARGVHVLRSLFHVTGDMMVKEGRIPDSSLIYFMSLYQMITLMHSVDNVILQKAMRRRRLWSTMNSYVFPEVMLGWPSPISSKICVEPGACQVKGVPVFPGQATGRACVVRSLDDCGQIQDGDVLVTRCIDIGWSPYFPLLRGVVVEMGGLLSHGIVIVREYGLPSLVDATNATSVFNTVGLNDIAGFAPEVLSEKLSTHNF